MISIVGSEISPDVVLEMMIAPFDEEVGGLDKVFSERYGPAVGAYQEKIYHTGKIPIPEKPEYYELKVTIYRKFFGSYNESYRNIWGLAESEKTVSFFYEMNDTVFWVKYFVTHPEGVLTVRRWSASDDPEVLKAESVREIGIDLEGSRSGIFAVSVGFISAREKEELRLVFGQEVPEKKPGWEVYSLPYGWIEMRQKKISHLDDSDEDIVANLVRITNNFETQIASHLNRAGVSDPETIGAETSLWMERLYEAAARFEE